MHTHPGAHTALEVKRVLCDEEGVDPRHVVLGHSGDTTDVEHLSDTVVEMCRRAYADHMVLSQDASCYIDWVDPAVLSMMTQWRYLHIEDDVLPYLREKGVTDGQITTMLADVPRRFFEPARA